MEISITVKGELVRKGLQDLSAEIPKIGRQQIRTRMERIKRRMQEYPAEPSGQSSVSSHPILGNVYRTNRGRYHRTGNLGGHWAIEDIGNGYKIVNTAQRKGRPYGVYVVGDAYGRREAWMHKGRWQLLRDVVEEEVETLPPDIEEQITMVARRVGL